MSTDKKNEPKTLPEAIAKKYTCSRKIGTYSYGIKTIDYSQITEDEVAYLIKIGNKDFTPIAAKEETKASEKAADKKAELKA